MASVRTRSLVRGGALAQLVGVGLGLGQQLLGGPGRLLDLLDGLPAGLAADPLALGDRVGAQLLGLAAQPAGLLLELDRLGAVLLGVVLRRALELVGDVVRPRRAAGPPRTRPRGGSARPPRRPPGWWRWASSEALLRTSSAVRAALASWVARSSAAGACGPSRRPRRRSSRPRRGRPRRAARRPPWCASASLVASLTSRATSSLAVRVRCSLADSALDEPLRRGLLRLGEHLLGLGAAPRAAPPRPPACAARRRG